MLMGVTLTVKMIVVVGMGVFMGMLMGMFVGMGNTVMGMFVRVGVAVAVIVMTTGNMFMIDMHIEISFAFFVIITIFCSGVKH